MNGCDICMQPHCQGECTQGPDDETLLALAEERNRWRHSKDYPPETAGCPHVWCSCVDVDGGDVTVHRRCLLCKGYQYQVLFTEPEPPNCYVPGAGWEIV